MRSHSEYNTVVLPFAKGDRKLQDMQGLLQQYCDRFGVLDT
jgi:hypothetical protein